jgi:HSP20 family protein
VHDLLLNDRPHITTDTNLKTNLTMKLTTYNRPLPSNFFRFFDDHATKAKQLDASHRPAVNIVETEDAYELELLAPGRAKENFNLAFNEGTLEVTYTTPTAEPTVEMETSVKSNFRRREFSLVDFTRRFQLDDKVIDIDAIDATYVDGVLRLALPKREEALPKAPRQIEVA